MVELCFSGMELSITVIHYSVQDLRWMVFLVHAFSVGLKAKKERSWRME